MKKIPLSQGKFALVDDEDYDFLMQWKWCVHKPQSGIYYAVRSLSKSSKPRNISMHRAILNVFEPKQQVDHIDGNGLNNQRNNIRVCSSAENRRNQKVRSYTKSGYKGVKFEKKGHRWIARINVDQKSIHLGMFDTAEEAARHYNAGAIKYHGAFARLNQVEPLLPTTPAIFREKKNFGLRGVYWREDMNMWRTKINVNKKQINLGHFNSVIDAARTYNEAAIKYYGDRAILNDLALIAMSR